jgi:hypothetical protein
VKSPILVALLLLASLVLAVAMAVTIPPLPNCSWNPPPSRYLPAQTTHEFFFASSFGATIDSQFYGLWTKPMVFDTSGCATGDGDNDAGVGGAQFPETSQGACDPAAPVVGHHNGGVGATATIQTNTANLPVDFTFGTDGQDPAKWFAGQTCTGNDIISDSYDTDPFDCGQGVTGHFPGTSATLAANVNPHDGSTTDPDPWAASFGAIAQNTARTDPNNVMCFGVNDGSAWASTIFGPSVSGLPGLTGGPLLDLTGCPVIGDSSSVGGGLAGTGLLTGPLAGNNQCGIGSIPGIDPGSPSLGWSTPLDGTITAP